MLWNLYFPWIVLIASAVRAKAAMCCRCAGYWILGRVDLLCQSLGNSSGCSDSCGNTALFLGQKDTGESVSKMQTVRHGHGC
ncbi:hypothetical protein N658DRAFT_249254 [Parathielavia hyrcaniae]|uniref:Secreted protein n=1 Tax=Parathielavia hyrcaniae TaxID=113614 RepID=A0AAN6T4U4_9PEZI|nr:hypothetical protein N658DRAFT_249254 [Parathielavia hyrcaniae]